VMTQEIKFVSQCLELFPVPGYTCECMPTVLRHVVRGDWFYTCTRGFLLLKPLNFAHSMYFSLSYK
jgi:hypothetical protein